MKTATLIAGLILASITTFAKSGTETSNLTLADRENKTTEEINYEQEMVVENWMVDITSKHWNNTSDEEAVQLENWMVDINDKLWEASNIEPELELESWMQSPSDWLKSK